MFILTKTADGKQYSIVDSRDGVSEVVSSEDLSGIVNAVRQGNLDIDGIDPETGKLSPHTKEEVDQIISEQPIFFICRGDGSLEYRRDIWGYDIKTKSMTFLCRADGASVQELNSLLKGIWNNDKIYGYAPNETGWYYRFTISEIEWFINPQREKISYTGKGYSHGLSTSEDSENFGLALRLIRMTDKAIEFNGSATTEKPDMIYRLERTKEWESITINEGTDKITVTISDDVPCHYNLTESNGVNGGIIRGTKVA